jgi:hypothetical protein
MMAYTLTLPILLAAEVDIVYGMSNTTSEERRGWVSQPDGRGTIDILFSCLFTVFLCTWTSLHLNVPAPHETYWQQFRRKCRWTLQTIMGPEFVLGFASGQKVEAQRSVAEFKRNGYPNWTVRHGFYANMGGFHLKARGSDRTFPINSKHLLYLVQNEYITFPAFNADEIWDKSKADGFQKLFTCIQTGWFIIQYLGRAIQHLPITTFELTTLGFVFCTLIMYCQWANKPLDVQSPTIITTSASLEEILLKAGDAAREPYRQTPLDFVDDLSPSWLIDAQPHLRFRRGPPERPLPRFTNDRFPVIGASFDAILLLIVTVVYCSLHFVAWNWSFPTNIERVLWRVSSVAMVGTALVFWVCEIIQDGFRVHRWERWYKRMFPTKAEKAVNLQATPEERKKALFIPVWEVIVMLPVTFIYSLARTYIVIEIFLSQRSLPKGAFDSVDWSKYIPHF